MSESIQEVFWLTSADCQHLLYVSPAFESIWGYSLSRLYTYPGGYWNLLVDSIHPSDKERIVTAVPQQLQNEYHAEYRIVRADGEMRWVRSRSFPIQNQFGETWGIAGLSEDITERERNKETLHQREQEFRALVEHSPDIISRFDRELRHIYVNPAVELATGMPPQDFIGKTHRDLGTSQALLSLWEGSLQKVFQTGEPDEHEFGYSTPSGWKHYQSRLFPELAVDGSVKSVLGICRDLTKTKQTEEALRESEQRFRSVFESAPVGMVLVDKQGMFIETNQAFQNLLGYTGAELHNLSFMQLTHPDDQAESLELFQELLTGKRHHFSQEKRYFRKDGCLIWSNISVSAIYDANGSFQYVVTMIQDISDAHRQAAQRKQAELERQKAYDELEQRVVERTALLEQSNSLLLEEIAERKQAEVAIKAQKEFLQTIIDTNPNRIFVKDREGKTVLANQAYADFYGITVEEILGKTTAQLNPHPADLERFLAQDQEVLTTLQPKIILEEACQTLTGEVNWFQTLKKPLFSSDGQVYGIFGVCTDITERKLVEQALRESEQRYRLLIEGMNEGVIIVDENGIVSYVNEKLTEMLGYSAAEMIGTHKSEFLDEANLKIVQEQRARRRRGESGSYELGLKKKDGQTLFTIASGTPILGADGSFKGSFKVITDITALKMVESELQQAKEQLRAVLDAVPGFVSWINGEGRYLGVNQHLAGRFNLSPDAFVGKELGFMRNSPRFVQFIEQFLTSAAQTDRQVIEVQVNGITRNYLIAAQKYNQDTRAVSVGIDITERQQAEEELKAQKDFLQTVLDANPSLIWVKDMEDRIILGNQALADFFGLTIEDLLGKTNFDLHANPVHALECIAQDQEVLTTLQQKFIPEEAFPNSIGEVRWFQTIKKPLFSNEGQVYGVLGVSTDITKRKQAEEALHRSEARFRLAIDNIPDVFVLYDAQRRFQFVNAEGINRSGKPLEEHLGYTDEEIWPNQVTDKYLPILKRAVETRTLQTGECNIALPNTDTFTIVVTYVPLLDGEGKIYQILGITHDITARKQAEEQLRQREEQLHLTMDAARIGFWNWNFQTKIITWSPNLERMYGLAPGTYEGTYKGFLARLYSEDFDLVYQTNQRAIETGEDWDIEFRIVLPDGNIRWMQSQGHVFYDERGRLERMAGINLDISDRKLAETRIKESLREKEVLLKEIHHRVKNNLQVISSLLDLQSQYIQDRSMLEVFRESCNRVKSMALVHEQLYESKDCARINCVGYIENLTNYLFRIYGVKTDQITLELDIDEVSLEINTAIPCGLIINELVSNALKYAFPNNRQGTIKVALHFTENKHFTIIIRDNGIGFSQDLDFKSIKSLGLQLVKVLANQLEGTLEIEHTLGTEFRISFLEASS